MGDGNFMWWCGSGGEPERYDGPFGNRDEAIGAGLSDYEDGFTICEADKSVMRLIFDEDRVAELIMEDIGESNEECFGEEGANDAWSDDADACHDLAKAIKSVATEWLKAHPGRTWAFGVRRNEEYFPPIDSDGDNKETT